MKKNILLLLALILSSNHTAFAFKTLKQMQDYAAQRIEFPKPDNSDWEDPNYTKYHKSILPSALDRFRWAVGFEKAPLWSACNFKKLLLEVIAQQKASREPGRFVAKLACTNDSKIFVWGDLHGAFHSLVRDLSWLADQGIIDQSLKIIKPNYYIVFNGDLVNRSPYTLETLTVVLMLLKQNPDTAIYVMGRHENKEHWFSYGLKRELILRAFCVSPQESIPLRSEVDLFFDALPLALYLYEPAHPHDTIRISYRTREDSEIDETLMDSFFDTPTKSESPLSYYDTTKRVPNPSPIAIESIIETEEWRRNDIRAVAADEYGLGLGFLNQDWGSTAWSVLSAPIGTNQTYFNFHYDAFALIATHDPITKSTIEVYNRDMRTSDPFQKTGPYNIVTGFDKDLDKVPEIAFTIGSSMALIQGASTIGQEAKRGFLLRIGQENRAGGIHGKMIKVIIYNDNYNPALTIKNIHKLIQRDHISVIALPVGTSTVDAISQAVKTDEVSVLFPITGSASLRNPDYKDFIHFRASYSDEVRVLIDYVLSKTIARKFLFFYQDDAYGIGALEAAHEELKKRGITNWVDVSYQKNTVDFKTQAQKIQQAQPDAIGLFSTAIATRDLLREVGIESLINTELFGLSFLGELPFRHYLKNAGLSVLFGAVVPNPAISNLEIVKEYRKAMDEYKYPYDVFSLEAYIAASILVDAMKKIQGPITREKIMQQLESIKDYDFKGLKLSFNPERRDLMNNLWIETGDTTQWIEKKKPKEPDNKPVQHPTPPPMHKPEKMEPALETQLSKKEQSVD